MMVNRFTHTRTSDDKKHRPKYLLRASVAAVTASICLMTYWYHGDDILDLSWTVLHTQSA